MSEEIQERRNEQRWRWTLQAQLEWKGGKTTAFTTDVSSIGMFVEASTKLGPGDKVKVSFRLVDGDETVQVVASGNVIRQVSADDAAATGQHRGLGIAFRSFSAGKKQLIKALKAAREGGNGSKKRRERRSGPRLTIGLPVRWGLEDPPKKNGRLINLASGGLFVATDDAPAVGVRVYLAFFLPEDGKQRRVKAIARVARVDAEEDVYGMAVNFETSSMGEALLETLKERLAEERLKPTLLNQDLSTAASTISAAAKDMDLPRIRLGGKYHVFRWKWVMGWFLGALLLYVAAYFALGAGVMR